MMFRNSGSTAGALKALICGAVLLSTMAFATTANAWAYTVTSSTAFTAGGVSGTINMVTTHLIPAPTPSLTTAGSVTTPHIQDWIWFSITLDALSESIDRVQMTVLPYDILDAEQFPQGDIFAQLAGEKNPRGGGFADSLGGEIPDSVTIPGLVLPSLADYVRWDWAFGLAPTAAHLEAGETSSELLWVGEQLQSGGAGVIADNFVNFMIHEVGGLDYTVQVQVPEPSTALLLGSGLIGLALTQRRRAN